MGCHSGKASGAQSIDNHSSPRANGTLLAPQVSEEKKPSTAEDVVPQKAASRSQVCKPGMTMIVTDCGKLYSTYEGIARALDVYHTGWVAAFSDVKNGDTGTLLSEARLTSHDAVALRIHRNGAIVCLARKGVALAGFNGLWSSGLTHGHQHSGKFAGQIGSEKLVLSDGRVSPIQMDETTGVLSVTFGRGVYTAELCEDDKIHWHDGDVWSRHEGPGPKDDVPVTGPTPASECMDADEHILEASTPDSPAAATECCLSTVDEATQKSTSTSIRPNPMHLETSEVEAAPLSPEKPLFALAAAQNDHVGVSEKKVRRERTMCCC